MKYFCNRLGYETHALSSILIRWRTTGCRIKQQQNHESLSSKKTKSH